MQCSSCGCGFNIIAIQDCNIALHLDYYIIVCIIIYICCFTYPLFSTALLAYSIWNTLPSGEYVEADKSYCNHLNNVSSINTIIYTSTYACAYRTHILTVLVLLNV